MNMSKGFKQFLESLPPERKEQFDRMVKIADREQELFTVPLQTDYNTSKEDIENISAINEKFFNEKFPNIVSSFFLIFPELNNVAGARESIEAILKRKQGTAYGNTGSTSAKRVPKVAGNIQTKVPQTWVTPTDKVSSLAFDGADILYNPKLVGVQLNSRRSKKEILSWVRIDFSDENIQIHGRKELNPYDREVHDALVTLFVDGENEYITPRMIYRAMTGNNEAKLMPKQQEAISNSLNKLMYSRLIIKASKEECEAYGFDKFSYEGTVIQGEKVTATVNGTEVVEVYHLLKEPVLYTYASKKNQIGRLDIKLLNSPVKKNEENITLQGYLYRRILAIKTSSKLSPTIVYDTVYKQLNIEAASDGALRKKKSKVRNTIRQILDYWKTQGFIKGYKENNSRNEIVSITIHC